MLCVASRSWMVVLFGAGLALCEACDALLELDRFTLLTDAQVAPVACTSDAMCAGTQVAAVCSVQLKQCVPVLEAGCVELTGELGNPAALRLGALLSLHGPQRAINRERQRGLQLAVEHINTAGGVPDAQSGKAHPIALTTCDTGDDPLLAGRHLIEDLGVPAIIGPNSSEDTLTLATGLSIKTRTLTLSPTAMASSLRDLADDDLSWLMVPTDEQRAPLMQAQIQALEHKLAADRSEPIKLSVVYRDDAFGHGVRLSLKSLTINGKPLSDPDNQANAVSIAMYEPSLRDMPSLIAEQLAFKPDILVLAGMAESISEFMRPFEERLHATTAYRPQYVVSDASKVSELLELARRVPDLAERVHGVGLAPSDGLTYRAFERAFVARYPDGDPQLNGVATAYDAVYALAFGAAAASGRLDGPGLASGLRALEEQPALNAPADLAQAFRGLEQVSHVAHGAFVPFAWDERGAPRSGKLELWCVGASGFASSGVVFELGSEISETQLTQAQACGSSAGTPSTSIDTQTVVVLAAPPSAAEPETVDALTDADAGVQEPDKPELYAEYRSANADPFDALIAPWLRVGNRGSGAGVRLDQIKLRYYVTNETNPLCLRDCIAELYWVGLMPVGTRVPAQVEYVTSGWLSGYLELSFAPEAPALHPHEYVELQLQFHTGDYQPLDETNDYSFDAAHRDFAEFRRVAVYLEDRLVWGDLPLW